MAQVQQAGAPVGAHNGPRGRGGNPRSHRAHRRILVPEHRAPVHNSLAEPGPYSVHHGLLRPGHRGLLGTIGAFENKKTLIQAFI